MNRTSRGISFLALATLLSAAPAFAQSAAAPAAMAAPSTGTAQTSRQSPFYGSIPAGQATSEVLQLSLADAIDRGLKQNLGVLLSADSQTESHGQLWEARSVLLPNLSARISENAAQVNLAAQGFGKIASRFPGFPLIVGPFGFFDARATASQSLLDLHALDNERSASRSADATKLSYQDSREMVVLVVGATYLQTIEASARVDTAQAQVNTAQALYDQSVDLKKTGVSAGIDVLRSQVELQTQQQMLIAARNDFAKQKLILARTIGLPLAQPFTLSETAPYEAPEAVTIEDALNRAYKARNDYQSAMTQVRAAELSLSAAKAEHLPSFSAYADYGVIGPTPADMHGTFTAYAAMQIPIFAGNRAHGDALIAQSALDRARQQLDNLRAQVEEDVRTSLLDLQSASDQVQVAKSNVDLAQQTITQARDRFNAGATDNIEVVQAQESVARANESYISSLYAYNLARMDLARATGSAEQTIRQYWKEK